MAIGDYEYGFVEGYHGEECEAGGSGEYVRGWEDGWLEWLRKASGSREFLVRSSKPYRAADRTEK